MDAGQKSGPYNTGNYGSYMSPAEPVGSIAARYSELFSGQNTPFWGAVFTGLHEVGFNRRRLDPVGTTQGTHTQTQIDFKINTTLGHLLNKIYMEFDMQVTIDLKKVRAAIHAASPNAQDETETTKWQKGNLAKCLREVYNIKLLRNQAWGMLDHIDFEHNTQKIQTMAAERHMKMWESDGYTKEDRKLLSWQGNGHGWPRYTFWTPDFPNGNIGSISATNQHDKPQGTAVNPDGTISGRTYVHSSKYGNSFVPSGPAWQDAYTDQYYGVTPGGTEVTEGVKVGGFHHLHGALSREKSQFQQLADHMPYHQDAASMTENYISEFYNEIGLKDIPYYARQSKKALMQYFGAEFTGANYSTYNEATGTASVTVTYPLICEVPHAFHYKLSDAFPCLNCVNNPDMKFTFKDPKQWIQNNVEVANYVTCTHSNHKLLLEYYDIPKAHWDTQFPMERQINYPVHDYQEYVGHEQITWNDTDPYHMTTITVQGIDRNVRYLTVFFQDRAQQNNQHRNLKHEHLTDCIMNCWVEVNGERLLTKINTETHSLQVHNREFQFGKEGKAFNGFRPGFQIYLPFAIDCDWFNHGGGHIHTGPFHNNLKVLVQWDNRKIAALYKKMDPVYSRYYNTHATHDTLDKLLADDLVNTTQDGARLANKYDSHGFGSSYGMLQKTANGYTMDCQIHVRALILDMITFDHGQFYKHCTSG